MAFTWETRTIAVSCRKAIGFITVLAGFFEGGNLFYFIISKVLFFDDLTIFVSEFSRVP